MKFQVKMTTVFNVVYNAGIAVEQGVSSFLESPIKKVSSFPFLPEFIFRTPIKLSKPGELREEYESLRKV